MNRIETIRIRRREPAPDPSPNAGAPVRRTSGPWRRHMLFLLPLALLFLAVTLGDRNQLSDEGSYLRYAEHLADGYYTRESTPDLWFGPGLPILLVPLTLVDAPLELMRILFGPVLLFLAVALFYATLRLFFSPRAAVVGAAALGLYWPFYVLLPSLHSEIPAIFFITALMYALTRYLREGRFSFLALSVGSAAMLALTRVVFGWILVAGLVVWALVALVRRDPRSRRVALVHGLALVLCVPWLAYTYSISGNVFYWGSSGGLSAYWMASPYPGDLGDWHSKRDVYTDPNLAPHRPFFNGLGGLNQIEADAELRSEAVELVRANPTEYTKNVAANASRMWFSMPHSFTPQKLSTLFYVFPNGLLLIGLLAAAALLWLRRSTVAFEAAPFAVLLLLGLAVQVLLAAYVRMITPLVPLMVFLIVYAWVRYVRLTRPDERRAVSSPR